MAAEALPASEALLGNVESFPRERNKALLQALPLNGKAADPHPGCHEPGHDVLRGLKP